MCLPSHDGSQILIYDNRIFKAGTKFSKERYFYSANVPFNGSFVGILDTKDAVARRSFYNSHFSREHMRRTESLVQTLSLKFLDVLQAAASEDKEEYLNFTMGFRCLTSDVIMKFTFNKLLGRAANSALTNWSTTSGTVSFS